MLAQPGPSSASSASCLILQILLDYNSSVCLIGLLPGVPGSGVSVWTTPGAEEELQIQSSWYLVAMGGGGKCKAFSVVPGQSPGWVGSSHAAGGAGAEEEDGQEEEEEEEEEDGQREAEAERLQLAAIDI